MKLYQPLELFVRSLIPDFDNIPHERKKILQSLANWMNAKIANDEPVKLNYICTHNSRRSHFGQVWGATAARWYGVPNTETYSGGVEVTAFNPNAIAALKRAGFEIEKEAEGVNPRYRVKGADDFSVTCFSKKFDDVENPLSGFAAVMTCSEVETNCPYVPGAEAKFSTTYNDPKAFDNTPNQDDEYSARCRQIALENLYLMSLVKT
jgi:hypothetical protein